MVSRTLYDLILHVDLLLWSICSWRHHWLPKCAVVEVLAVLPAIFATSLASIT
jgi:hypothetical protein